MSDPVGGTDISGIIVSAETKGVDETTASLDKMGTATISVVKNLDDLTNATEKNSKWIAEANQQYKNKIQLLEEQWKAEQQVIVVEKEGELIRQKAIDDSFNLIIKLKELNETYGFSREQLLRYQAVQLGVTEAAEPLIVNLERLKQADEEWAIQQRRDIELHVQRQKDYIEEAAAVEKLTVIQQTRDVEMNALRQKETTAYSAWWEEQVAIQDAALAEQASALTAFEAFKIRTFAENRKQAILILDEMEREATALAEKQAIEEIKWNSLSVQSRIAELERLKAYQANSAIQPDTINKSFSSAAINDINNLTKLQMQYAETLKKTSDATKKTSEATDGMGVSFGNARAKTEVLILAHEALQGRYTKIPASLMVLAEYTNAASLAMSGMCVVTLAAVASFILLGYELIKGEQQTKAFNDALTRTNGISGETTASLEALAHTAGAVHGNFKEAYEATALLAGSGKFTAQQIDMITSAVVNVNHAFGTPIQETIKQFESLAVHATGTTTATTLEVTKALEKLDEQYHFVNATLMEEIIQLEKQGEQQKASTLAIKAFTDEGNRAAEESEKYMGSIEKGWNSVKKAINEAKQAMADIGKDDPATEMATIAGKIDTLMAQQAKFKPGTFGADAHMQEIADLQNEYATWEALLKESQAIADQNAAKRKVQSDADHALTNRAIEDQKLMKKSTSELQDALDKFHAENKTIELAHPGYIESHSGGEGSIDNYLNEREAAIIKQHTIEQKGVDARKEIRKDDLLNQKAEFESEKEVFNDRDKMLTKYHQIFALSDDAYYKGRAIARQEFITAEAKTYAEEIAIIESYSKTAKNPKEVAENKTKYDTIVNQHKAFIQKMNALSVEDEIDQQASNKRIQENSDNAFDKHIDDLHKELTAAKAATLSREKSKAAVELETIALMANAEARMIDQVAMPVDDTHTQADHDAAVQFLADLQLELDIRKQISEELIKQEEIEFSKKAAQQAIEQWKEVGTVIGNALSTGFGKGGAAIGQISKAYAEYNSTMLKDKKRLDDANKLSAATEQEAAFKSKAIQEAQIQNGLDMAAGYANIATAAQTYFEQGSTGYAAMGAAIKVMHAAELALSVVKGINAILTQGSGDPYSAFARMAAMAAIVVGLGVAIGGSFSNKSDNSQSAEVIQKAQGTGTVFGDANAKSDSIKRALDLLANNSDSMLPLTSSMAMSLRNIEASMTGLTNIVLRTTGVTDASNMGIATGSSQNSAGLVKGIETIGTTSMTLTFGLLGNMLAQLGNKVLGSLFGKTTSNITDSGIQYGGPLSSLQNGQGFNQYANVHTDSSSLFGLVKHSNDSIQTQGLGDELSNQFGLIFKNLEGTLKTAATLIGDNSGQVGHAIDGMVIETTKMSLKGLTGQALQDAINAVISKTMDQVAQTAFPEMEKFRQVGEGYAQTVIRVTNEYQQVSVIFDLLGHTLTQTGMAGVTLSQNLITAAGGIEALVSGTKNFSRDYLSEAEQLVPVTKAVKEEMARLNESNVTTVAQFKQLVMSQDLTTDAGQKMYGALIAIESQFKLVADAANGVAVPARTAADIADERRNLQDQLDQLTMTSIQLHEKERNAIDASNQGLYDQIQALTALAAAIEAANQAAVDAANKLVADTAATYQKASTAVDSALAGMSRSINLEKAALQTEYDAQVKAINAQHDLDTKAARDQLELANNTVNSIKRIYDLLNSTVLDGMEMTRQTAKSVLNSALASSNAGGSLSNFPGLETALKTVAEPSQDLFKTFVDYKRDQAKTGDTITKLTANASSQVTVANLTVDAINRSILMIDQRAKDQIAVLTEIHNGAVSGLDQMMAISQQQVDHLKGIDNSTLSMSLSFAKLSAAITTATAAQQAAGQATTNAGAINNAGNLSITDLYHQILGRDPKQEGLAYWGGEFGTGALTPAQVARFIQGAGPELAAKAAGGDALRQYYHDHGIPGYAAGGDFGGGLRLVGENGPEIEATGAARIFNAQQTSSMLKGGNNELVDEIKNLKNEIAKLKSSSDRTANAVVSNESFFRRISPDGESIKVTVVA